MVKLRQIVLHINRESSHMDTYGFMMQDDQYLLVLPRLCVPIPNHLLDAIQPKLETHTLTEYQKLGLVEAFPDLVDDDYNDIPPVAFVFKAPDGWFACNDRFQEKGNTQGSVFDVCDADGRKLFEVSQIESPVYFGGRVRFCF
jgi:hypothetical protein